MDFEKIWNRWENAALFSGVYSVRSEDGVVFERCDGFRNRGEALPNNPDTAFGIASGTKLFTGLAACKLIDGGKLSLDDRLWDVLGRDLGQIDRRVTVRHLLTHTSGVGDYIDEEGPDSEAQEQALSDRYPVYRWERLEYYLQMITPLPPKFEPGARFGYSNAGFVLLGLVVEAVSGLQYQTFVTREIIDRLDLRHTGFYRADLLPANTAQGYLGDAADSPMRTNIFSLPVLGGSDGGLYTCAADLDRLWRAVFAGELLSGPMLADFLKPQVQRSENRSYGLGVYRFDKDGRTFFYAVGGDFGVDFFTAYLPDSATTASLLCNTVIDTDPLISPLFNEEG